MQRRLPMLRLRQVFRDAFRQENVTAVGAIHYSLSNIDPGAGNIDPIVHVADLIDRAAVDSHPQLNIGLALERPLNFNRATQRRFRTLEKNESHTIAYRQTDETPVRLRGTKAFRLGNAL